MLDIIIVNYKSTDYLINCLDSLKHSLIDIPANIFIQDNGSNNNVEDIKKQFPGTNLTFNSTNLGFSAAVNRGIKAGSNPFILLLNPDTIVKDGFLTPLIKYMEDNPDIGVVGPRVLNPDNSVQGSARTFPTLLTGLFGRSSILSRLFPNNRFTRGNIVTTTSDGKTPMEVDWVSGASMLVRRSATDDVGLMDERFFIFWEDADWCRRMWRKGWRVVYFPVASVVHYVGKSSEKRRIKSLIDFHKSSYRLFVKYTEWPFIKPFAAFILAFRFTMVSILYLVRQPLGILKKFRRVEAQSRPLTKKIKVLRIISRLNIGGPAIHVRVLSERLNIDKFDTMLITGSVSPHEGEMDYLFDPTHSRIVSIPELGREISLGKDIKTLIKIFKILLREKPQIVETHMAKAGFIGRIAAFFIKIFTFRRIISIHTFHGNIFKGYFSRRISNLFVLIERLMAKFTDFIIAISNTQKKELAEEFRIAPANKLKTIELGFDLSPFMDSRELKGTFRQRFKLKNTLLIGIVGRLAPIKNHMMFLEAAKAYIRQNPDMDVAFVLVGDGELRKDLEAFSFDQGLNNHVIFCGWIRDIQTVYADLDILALTSLNEGTPVSIIEAMASSVPVIATDAGGVIDLLGNPVPKKAISNGFTICERGLLCRKDNPFGFSKGLEWLIENNNSPEKAELIQRAKFFVKDRYSYKRLINDMEELYTDIVRQR